MPDDNRIANQTTSHDFIEGYVKSMERDGLTVRTRLFRLQELLDDHPVPEMEVVIREFMAKLAPLKPVEEK